MSEPSEERERVENIGKPPDLPDTTVTTTYVEETKDGLRRLKDPVALPAVGDILSKEGYVIGLTLDVPRFNPTKAEHSGEAVANRNLELQTYLKAIISAKPDEKKDAWEVRILHADRKHEYLAVTMAVAAVLKDAYYKKTKVKVWIQLDEVVWQIPKFGEFKSDVFRRLMSVELLPG